MLTILLKRTIVCRHKNISKSSKDLYNKLLKIVKTYYSYIKDIKKKAAFITVTQAVKLDKTIQNNETSIKRILKTLEINQDLELYFKDPIKYESLLSSMDLTNGSCSISCRLLKIAYTYYRYTYVGEYMYANFLMELSETITVYLNTGTFTIEKLTDISRQELVGKCSYILSKNYNDFVDKVNNNKKELIKQSSLYGEDLNKIVYSMQETKETTGSFNDVKEKEKAYITNLIKQYNETVKSAEVNKLINTIIDLDIDIVINQGKNVQKQ